MRICIQYVVNQIKIISADNSFVSTFLAEPVFLRSQTVLSTLRQYINDLTDMEQMLSHLENIPIQQTEVKTFSADNSFVSTFLAEPVFLRSCDRFSDLVIGPVGLSLNHRTSI